MKIINCGNNANIQFTDTSLTTIYSYFTNTYNANPLNDVPYDNSLFTGGFSTTLCNLKITDFDQPITAGTNTQLTITGSDFGANRGNGYVKFVNTDACCTQVVKLNARDYISWSDNQIVVQVPSFVDSISVPLTSDLSIGGGNFLVKNAAEDSSFSALNSSSLPFNVYYSINQNWSYNDDKKLEVELRNLNGSGGYTLRLNPVDFPVGSNKRNIFIRAMKDWKCFTGVNIILGTDTTITGYVPGTPNGLNYVSFSPTALGTNIVALTSTQSSICGTNLADVMKKADITFNSNKVFVYDSTTNINVPAGQSDFYGTALHELGHYIGLRHHSDPSNLMYWTGNIGPLTIATVKRLAISSSPVDGGNYSVTQGNQSLPSCSGISVMISQYASCGNPNGINQYSLNNYFFNLYPNPSNGTSVNIEFEALTDSDAQLISYDMMGRKVYSNSLNNRNNISNKYELDISNLNSGMYFVNLVIDNVKVSHKLIRN